mgnify:CR=1 FL=1
MKKNRSYEDYLERILMLSKNLEHVRAIDIANSMGYSKPSVSIALKKLKANNLISVSDTTGYITLTESGNEIASSVLEKHEVITTCLVALGVSYDVALEDACNIEHDLSDEAFIKLKEYYYKTLKR